MGKTQCRIKEGFEAIAKEMEEQGGGNALVVSHGMTIGTIVYLHASFEVINSRLKNAKKRGVALRDGQTLKDLYDERVVLFEKYADITVSEDGLELEETIENVMEILENQ